MSERTQKILRWLGYISLAMFSFLFFFYQTFPYRRLFDSISLPFQRQQKIRIQMKDLRPYYLSGVDIKGLNIQRLVPKGVAEVQVSRVQASVSLFPLLWGTVSSSFHASIASGEINGSFSRTSNNQISLRTDLEGLRLGSLGPPISKRIKDKKAKPLLEILFAPVNGRLKGNLKLDLFPPKKAKPKKAKPKKRSRRRRSRRYSRRFGRRSPFDMKQSEGQLKLIIRGFRLGPGYFAAGAMGELPIPRLNLGTLNLQTKIEKGFAILKTARAFGGDIDLKITGKIQLRFPFRMSIFRGQIKFKIEKSFVDSLKPNSLLKAALSALPSPKPDGYITYSAYVPFYGKARFTKR